MVSLKIHLGRDRARNYTQNLGFPSENQSKKLGFPEIFRISIRKTQIWFWVSENITNTLSLKTVFLHCILDVFLLSRYLGDINSDYLCRGQNKSFPMVYDMLMFMSFSQGFHSENLAQNLDFLHHFWVCRKSGNPVISSPAAETNWTDGSDPWWVWRLQGYK